MNTPLHSRNRWAVLAIPLAGLLALSACSSGTVGSQAGASAKPGGSNQFSSIIPKGDIVAASKKLVDDSLNGSAGFTPPSGGPTAQKPGATIAFVGGDLTNGGINTVADGVKEAAAAIGWKVNVYDGKGTAQGRSDAMAQAIAGGAAAIVVGGFDPTEQAASIKQATSAGIPVVGWNAGVIVGPGNGMFANVAVDPLKVSQLAAAYAVADSGGKAGVAIFTDSQYKIAVEKAKAMEAYVKACSTCKVLQFQSSPIASADSDMPGIISNLLQQDGSKLTYILAINGNYFGGAAQALRSAKIDPAGPPKSVAAGDGDSAEFQRIRTGQYQAATVAAPLTLQGWEVVDEINRALAGQKWSGFVASPALITKQNAPTGDVFDPSSGYRAIYEKNWGK